MFAKGAGQLLAMYPFTGEDHNVQIAWDGPSLTLQCGVDTTYVGAVYLLRPSSLTVKMNVKSCQLNMRPLFEAMQFISFAYRPEAAAVPGESYPIGFAAENLHELEPSFVQGAPDSPGVMMPNPTTLLPALAKGLQEAFAEIENLRNQVKKLDAAAGRRRRWGI